MDEIAVSRLMSSHVECVRPGATLAEAANLMHGHAHSCLVVAALADVLGGREPRSVVEMADKALYRAKSAGKNTVELYRTPRKVAA